MNKIKKWLYGGYDNEFYKKHLNDAHEHNSKILSISLVALSIFCLSFVLVHELTGLFNTNVAFNLSTVGFMLVVYVIHKTITSKDAIKTGVILPIFIFVFFAFLIVIDTYYKSESNGVIFFAFIIVIPIVIIAPLYFTLVIDIVSLIAFMICSYIFKQNVVFYTDLLYGACSLFGGGLIGGFVLKNTFDGYALRDKFNYQSRYDPLTNIYNRRAAHAKLEEIMVSENKIALAMIDIDDFKRYNDTYGHIKGDEVLRVLANIFLNNVKPYGFFVSRFGGEEFIIVTYGDKMDLIEEILAKSAQQFEEAWIVDTKSKVGHVTFSAGYTKIDKKIDIGELVDIADQGLYIAKSHGKNQFYYNEYKEE